MRIADRSRACSTLVIGNFPYSQASADSCRKSFIKTIKYQIKQAEEGKEFVYAIDPYVWGSRGKLIENLPEGRMEDGHYRCSRGERKALDGHPVSSFAFFYGTFFSTKTGNQQSYHTNVKEVLEEFGFTISKEPTYNKKNGTFVHAAFAPVPVVLKKLSLYDDDGNLLQKAGNDVAKPKRASKKVKAVLLEAA